MKAYALRNHEAELIWSWEPEPQPPGTVAVSAPNETSCNSLTGDSARPVEPFALEPLAENPRATPQATLSALESCIIARQESEHQDAKRPVGPDSALTPTLESRLETLAQWVQAALAGIGVVLRQQVEEIHELKEQAGRAERQAESWSAQTCTLHSRLDILDERIQTFLDRMDSAVSDQRDHFEKQVESNSAQLRILQSHVKGPYRALENPPATLGAPFAEPAQGISKLRALAGERRQEQERRHGLSWSAWPGRP